MIEHKEVGSVQLRRLVSIGLSIVLALIFLLISGNVALTAVNRQKLPALALQSQVEISMPCADTGISNKLDYMNLRQMSNFSIGGNVYEVTVAGNYAYLHAAGAGLRIFDITNRSAPVEVSAYTGVYASSSAIAGAYEYLASLDSLTILDISEPARPTKVGRYGASDGEAIDVAIVGSYAYVVGKDGLAVIDVSDPGNPVKIGSFAIPGYAAAIEVFRDKAYIAHRGNGLYIIDVANPEQMAEVGHYGYPMYLNDVAISGENAYLADGFNGLHIIDISNPTNPREIGSFSTLRSPYSVAVVGNYAFIGDYGTGLKILDVSNPAIPTMLEYSGTSDEPWSVLSTGNYTYLAGGQDGFLIFWSAPTTSAGLGETSQSRMSTIDDTCYDFPAGAFTSTVVISHEVRLPDSLPLTGRLVGIGRGFYATATYSSTGQIAEPVEPYTLTVQFTATEKGSAIEDTLALYYWDGTQWVREPSSIVDNTARAVVARPDRFGLWTVLGETRRVHIPMVASRYQPPFHDDFSSASSGWPTSEDEVALRGYLGGEYRILVKQPGYIYRAGNNLAATNFVAEVDARAISHLSGGYGLYFGSSSAGYYTYQIWDGKFWLRRFNSANGTWTILIDRTPSGSIRTGNQTNRLKVVRRGSMIRLFINGTYVGQITDSTLGYGYIGLAASGYQQDFDSRFDNFDLSLGLPVNGVQLGQWADPTGAIAGLTSAWILEDGPEPDTQNQ